MGNPEVEFTEKVKDVFDEITDEKIGEVKFTSFNISFDNGARAFGSITNGVASIAGINSPKSDSVSSPIRGFKTYERVLKVLSDRGVDNVIISNQSQDSRFVLGRLVRDNILINPRRVRGLSVDEHPTEFTINKNELNKVNLNENIKMGRNIIYSGVFVESNLLKQKYPPIFDKQFYHHVTIEFKPKDISLFPVGEKINLKIIGRLTTDKVDVLLVDCPMSVNKHPHITLSVNDGVKPIESNIEIENNLDKIQPLNDTVFGVYGLFDGKEVLFKPFETEELTEVTSDEVNLSSFEIQPTLNKAIWKGGKLNPSVRIKLLKIADDFMDFSNIKKSIVEGVIFIGSLTNYNWSSFSDFDLHILVDFKKINDDVELVKDYFDSKKKIWNDTHESLKIYNFPVELYVQDINEKNASTSIFSLEKNKWLKKPEPMVNVVIDDDKIKNISSQIMTKIDKLYEIYNSKNDLNSLKKLSNKITDLLDKIKKFRKDSLQTKDGEMSVGNIVFKVLRRTEYMSKLMVLKNSVYDKINSI